MVNYMSTKEKKLARFLDKLGYFILDFHYYFFLLFSILIIGSYYLGFMKAFNILFIIMICIYIAELLLGLDRNFLGFIGIFISGAIGYLCIKNMNGAFLAITYAILIVNILKLLLVVILSKYVNKRRK